MVGRKLPNLGQIHLWNNGSVYGPGWKSFKNEPGQRHTKI